MMLFFEQENYFAGVNDYIIYVVRILINKKNWVFGKRKREGSLVKLH